MLPSAPRLSTSLHKNITVSSWCNLSDMMFPSSVNRTQTTVSNRPHILKNIDHPRDDLLTFFATTNICRWKLLTVCGLAWAADGLLFLETDVQFSWAMSRSNHWPCLRGGDHKMSSNKTKTVFMGRYHRHHSNVLFCQRGSVFSLALHRKKVWVVRSAAHERRRFTAD